MGNENPRQIEEQYDIRIARDGSWWHNGGRIDRIGLVKLFASVLKRDAGGGYWLETPAERGRIAVEDAPFVAVEMQREGAGPEQVLRFRTNLDRWVSAGPDHQLTLRDSKPYIALGGGLEAACTRAVHYELMDLAGDGPGGMGVWSGGMFFVMEGYPSATLA